MAPHVLEETQFLEHDGLNRKELLQQLERIVTSTHFRNSKRYPSFLRFIVERTVEDNVEVLKERNLGTEVFGRPSNYDTNADPIVRVTAGEVRKRIAQYYQTPGHENELRIDLPLGSYVPHFHAGPPAAEVRVEHREQPSDPVSVLPAHESGVAQAVADPVIAPGWRTLWTKSIRQGVLYLLAAVGVAALAYFAVIALQSRIANRGTDYFWQSVTPSSNGALIVMGVHFIDSTGKSIPADARTSALLNEIQDALASMESSDMVPVSDVVSYSKLTDTLARRSIAYRTKSADETTLQELRSGPVVLLGGFNNLWTLRLTSGLRFRFVPKTPRVNSIVDSQNPASVWTFDNAQPALSSSHDYAIVASYYDTTIEQHVVIAAGIGKNGTIAACEFLTTERDLKSWLDEQKLPANKNIELVLQTDVLDGQAGPPHVIASSVW